MVATASRPHARSLRSRRVILLGAGRLVRAANRRCTADKLVEKRHDWHVQQARLKRRKKKFDGSPLPAAARKSRTSKTPPRYHRTRPTFTEDYKSLRTRRPSSPKPPARNATKPKRTGRSLPATDRLAAWKQQQAAYGLTLTPGRNPSSPSFVDASAILWAAVISSSRGGWASVVGCPFARPSVAAVLFSLLTASRGFGPPLDGRPWMVREDAKLTDDLKDTTEKADAAVAEANKKWTATLNGWANLVSAPAAIGDPVEAILRDGENDVRKSVQEATVNARVADRLTAEAEAERTQLETDKAKLATLTSSAKMRSIAYAVGRCAVIALLFGFAIMPYWRALRKEAALIRADAKKCPRCFSTRLVVEKNAVLRTSSGEDEEEEDEDERPRYRKPKGKTKYKKKVKDEDEQEQEAPKETAGYVECKSCSFRFLLRSYQKVRRLCFLSSACRTAARRTCSRPVMTACGSVILRPLLLCSVRRRSVTWASSST